jgi:hypothetical protein
MTRRIVLLYSVMKKEKTNRFDCLRRHGFSFLFLLRWTA